MDYMPNVGDEVIVVRLPELDDDDERPVDSTRRACLNKIGTVMSLDDFGQPWVKVRHPGTLLDWWYDISWLEPADPARALVPEVDFDETKGDF